MSASGVTCTPGLRRSPWSHPVEQKIFLEWECWAAGEGSAFQLPLKSRRSHEIGQVYVGMLRVARRLRLVGGWRRGGLALEAVLITAPATTSI